MATMISKIKANFKIAPSPSTNPIVISNTSDFAYYYYVNFTHPLLDTGYICANFFLNIIDKTD